MTFRFHFYSFSDLGVLLKHQVKEKCVCMCILFQNHLGSSLLCFSLALVCHRASAAGQRLV